MRGSAGVLAGGRSRPAGTSSRRTGPGPGSGPHRSQRRRTVRHSFHAVLTGQQAHDVLPHVGIVVRHQHTGPVGRSLPERLEWDGQGLPIGGHLRVVVMAASGLRQPCSASSTNGLAPVLVTARVWLVASRSRGRWADPSGTVTVNVVPLPTSLSAEIEPPCSSTNS